MPIFETKCEGANCSETLVDQRGLIRRHRGIPSSDKLCQTCLDKFKSIDDTPDSISIDSFENLSLQEKFEKEDSVCYILPPFNHHYTATGERKQDCGLYMPEDYTLYCQCK